MLVPVITEFAYWLMLNFAIAPGEGSGNVASSLSASLLLHSEFSQDAARRSECPTGACSSQRKGAKCFFFFNYRCFWSWGVF